MFSKTGATEDSIVLLIHRPILRFSMFRLHPVDVRLVAVRHLDDWNSHRMATDSRLLSTPPCSI